MSVAKVTYEGIEYEIAPMEPEHHDRPSPAYPVAITPAVARSWLKYNYRNRNQRKGAKSDYSSDMREDRYDVNGTTITFSRPLKKGEDERVPEGHVVLIDGQHRLESCIIAGKPFIVYVAYGLNPEVRRTVDTGVKRAFADVLAMGGETNAFVLASVVKRAHAWENDDKHLTLKKSGMTHSQGKDFLADHPELRRSAEIAQRTQHTFHLTTQHDLRQSVAGFAHWLFMKADETKTPEFFARLGDGAVEFGHPISQLRRRLLKDKTERKQVNGDTRRDIPFVADWQMLCYYIRTWNEYLKGPNLDGSYRNFQMIGNKDREKIPAIWTPKEADAWALKQLEKAEKEEQQQKLAS